MLLKQTIAPMLDFALNRRLTDQKARLKPPVRCKQISQRKIQKLTKFCKSALGMLRFENINSRRILKKHALRAQSIVFDFLQSATVQLLPPIRYNP